jgi:hypothetical protein
MYLNGFGKVFDFREKGHPHSETDLFLFIAFLRGRKNSIQLPPVCPNKYFSNPRLSIFEGTLS